MFQPTEELPWGYCGSPILVDDKIIVNPGAADASLVAVHVRDGSVAWKSAGGAPSYGSFIVGMFGKQTQIVGHDAKSIGGWSVETGKRLWTIVPRFDGEFNVPTPVEIDGKLLVSTEQNGTRLYQFDDSGIAQEEPIAINSKLLPDMSSPIVVGNHLYCVKNFLYCLDVADGLKEKWRLRDKAFSDYGSLLATNERLLAVGDSELLLFRADGEKTILSRQVVFDTGDRLYSHPALVGTRLVVRGESRMVCIELD